MISDFLAWLPGPLATDIVAIVGTVVIVGILGWLLTSGAGLFLDWRRSAKAVRPIGEPAVVAAPVEVAAVPRSPFRRKREVAK